MIILGIESSCDECSLALVEREGRIIAMVTASQIETHQPHRGVVPELASRAHVATILKLFYALLDQSGLQAAHINAIGVTTRPGLTGSLMVGLSFAKALGYGLQIPVVDINHILAHLYAVQLEQRVDYPHIGVVISGGHTLIGIIYSPEHFELLGETVDDACGETFDKIAVHLGLGYPGGPAIEHCAQSGNPQSAFFPQAELEGCSVSFSGLKSAVIHQREKFWNRHFPPTTENICAAFQQAAIGMIVRAIDRAVALSGISAIVIGGGVAANSYLRSAIQARDHLTLYCPTINLCGDNGAMVAGLAAHHLLIDNPMVKDSELEVCSRVRFPISNLVSSLN